MLHTKDKFVMDLSLPDLLTSCMVWDRLNLPVSLLPSASRICSVVKGCASFAPVEACCMAVCWLAAEADALAEPANGTKVDMDCNHDICHVFRHV